MNRRRFLRLLGLSAGVVSVPVVLSGVDVKFQTMPVKDGKGVTAADVARAGKVLDEQDVPKEGRSLYTSLQDKARLLREVVFEDPVLTEYKTLPPVEVFEPHCEYSREWDTFVIRGLAFPKGSNGPTDGRYFTTKVDEELADRVLTNPDAREDLRREIHESTARALYSPTQRAVWNKDLLKQFYDRVSTHG